MSALLLHRCSELGAMGFHNVSAVNITDDVLAFYESIPICPSSGPMSFGRWKLCRSASQTDNGNPLEWRHAHNFSEVLRFPYRPFSGSTEIAARLGWSQQVRPRWEHGRYFLAGYWDPNLVWQKGETENDVATLALDLKLGPEYSFQHPQIRITRLHSPPKSLYLNRNSLV